MKEKLKKLGLEMGADAIGFCDVEPLSEDLLYREPLSFEEKDREKRLHPKVHFSEAKSAMVMLFSHSLYHNPLKKNQVKQASSSKKDYHIEVRKILKEIQDIIKHDYDINSALICDLEGLLDKEMASRAGLGYYGKNTLLINERLGTAFHIGYLLLDIKIDADSPIEGDCGTCQRCVEACPHGAILGYRLDPSHCISYLTQSKEETTLNLRGYFYGCDICQRVCPKNRVEALEEAFIYPEDFFHTLSNREFREQCSEKEFKWIGKNKLKRNCDLNRRSS